MKYRISLCTLESYEREDDFQTELATCRVAIACVEQVLKQLGENYLKSNIGTFGIVDAKGLGQLLNKSENTIRRWTNARIISCYKIPSGDNKDTYFYDLKRVKEDLDEYLQEAEI